MSYEFTVPVECLSFSYEGDEYAARLEADVIISGTPDNLYAIESVKFYDDHGQPFAVEALSEADQNFIMKQIHDASERYSNGLFDVEVDIESDRLYSEWKDSN